MSLEKMEAEETLHSILIEGDYPPEVWQRIRTLFHLAASAGYTMMQFLTICDIAAKGFTASMKRGLCSGPACIVAQEEDCDHEGHVVKGECEKCGERGLESDAEIYDKENPR